MGRVVRVVRVVTGTGLARRSFRLSYVLGLVDPAEQRLENGRWTGFVWIQTTTATNNDIERKGIGSRDRLRKDVGERVGMVLGRSRETRI
jgi:hypothetical protein